MIGDAPDKFVVLDDGRQLFLVLIGNEWVWVCMCPQCVFGRTETGLDVFGLIQDELAKCALHRASGNHGES